MSKQMFVILNFKAYSAFEGARAVNAVKLAASIPARGYSIICCPPASVLSECVKSAGGNTLVFAQSADAVEPGKHTGKTTLEQLKSIGVKGLLVNHSENRISFNQIIFLLNRAGKLGLKTVLCARNLSEVRKFSSLRPWAVAFEPPQLIGGRVSVSSAKPSVIADGVKAVGGKCLFLAGAGVNSREDLTASKKLGASGVLIASAFSKAADKKKFLRTLLV
ncbi:triose-phosphate isomerase [Candidatus Micrarchaeota archaeon]|nr:triose-phosphate isomerase [Candidatus Micrarchaeota archaeon]